MAYAEGKKRTSRCTEFAVIDIDQGELAWKVSLPRERATLGLRMSVAVSGGIAAIGRPGYDDLGGSAGYKISTGKTLWSAPPRGCAADARRLPMTQARDNHTMEQPS